MGIGKKTIHAYRKDRMQSMDMVEHKASFAFTSCSLKDTCDHYFMKKSGILLLEYEIPNSIPYIILNDVLKPNRYLEQEEILLPPFMSFIASKMIPSSVEAKYKDIKGKTEKNKYLLKPTGLILNNADREEINDIISSGKIDISKKEDVSCAKSVLMNLKEGKKIHEDDKKKYCGWKMKVQERVRQELKKIYESYGMDEGRD